MNSVAKEYNKLRPEAEDASQVKKLIEDIKEIENSPLKYKNMLEKEVTTYGRGR